VPEGQDRRELYKSQYRAIFTYKMSAQVRRALARSLRARALPEACGRACGPAMRGALTQSGSMPFTRQELDAAFREVLGSEWTIKSDERVKYVGKLEVEHDNVTLKVRAPCLPPPMRPCLRPPSPRFFRPHTPKLPCCVRAGHHGGLSGGGHVCPQVLHSADLHQVSSALDVPQSQCDARASLCHQPAGEVWLNESRDQQLPD
jgi:hypothetical protein